jgi:hypothetical protein
VEDPGKDDFELWSPSEERQEVCLFGRKVCIIFVEGGTTLKCPLQVIYHRRKREVDCVVGDQPKAEERIEENCACKATDFEWCVIWQRQVKQI